LIGSSPQANTTSFVGRQQRKEEVHVSRLTCSEDEK
jgi:hypothetical protein